MAVTFFFQSIGPAVSLFQKSYFELMKRALRLGGIVCSQADTFWGHLKNAASMYNHCKRVFAKAAYATSYVSTYPAGQIGFALGSLDEVYIPVNCDNDNIIIQILVIRGTEWPSGPRRRF